MDFSLTPEEEQFKKEVQIVVGELATPEAVEEARRLKDCPSGTHAFEIRRALGSRGWLTPTWPKKYGGLDGTNVQRLMVYDEMGLRGLQTVHVGTTMVGPILLMFGTEEQKEEYLPRIARGEIEFALGYTEPQAGSDMASLDIRAVEKDDHFVLNGQKAFNTGCHFADYHWLGVRTSTEGPKHKGISLLIVDLSSPGITIRPLWTMDGERTNEVFYDDVIVPQKNLVGEKDRGFYHIMTAMDFERLFPTGFMQRHFNKVHEFARTTYQDGKPLIENALIGHRIAEMATEMEILRLMSYRTSWMLDHDIVPTREASILKLFMFEFMRKLAVAGLQMAKLYGQLAEGASLCEFGGAMGDLYMNSIRRNITAGSSEIQRNVIATRGLGLPR